MNGILTYSIEGINQLVIETLASDAIVRGVPGATAIQVTFASPARPGGPEFIPEGQAVRFVHAAAERALVPDGLDVIVQEALGDLRVQGLAGQVSMDAVRGDLRLDALSGPVTVGAVDGDVRAEGVADLRLTGACRGDLRFEAGGALAAGDLSGDLRLSAAADVRLGRIHGNLWVEKVAGGVRIERADGDTRLNEIGGPAALGTLSGDFRAGGLAGGLTVTRISGDAALSGPFASPEGYTLAADGDIHLQLPADADVRLVVRAGGRIRSDLPLSPAADGSPTFSATVGQGAGRITLTARGDLRITQPGAAKAGASWEPRGRTGSDPFADLSGLGDRIRQQVTASLASAGINVETGEVNLGRSDRRRERHPAPFPPPPAPAPGVRARPAAPPPSAEEQMAILKMVEEGKVTAEEADILLKALGA